jgi:hypothetical protein
MADIAYPAANPMLEASKEVKDRLFEIVKRIKNPSTTLGTPYGRKQQK